VSYTVTEADREHFRAIGRWKAESHAEALRRHLALPLEQRLINSIAWSIVNAWRWPLAGDGPGPLREQARRLGMYRAWPGGSGAGARAGEVKGLRTED
jgi:hypothetical protein